MRTRFGRKVVVPIRYMYDSEVGHETCFKTFQKKLNWIENEVSKLNSREDVILSLINLYDFLLENFNIIKTYSKFIKRIIPISNYFIKDFQDDELNRKIYLVLSRLTN